VGLQGYRTVLGSRDVRNVLLLGLVVRIPLWAANVVLVLHVVSHLDRSYGAAGLLSAAATVALAISGPWRGRRLDKVGLRRALAPSLAVLTACWSVAPFTGYWPLLVLASIAGLFVVPSFSIVRQALIHAVPDEQRTAALAIDAVVLEISFMIGPALGVLLATYWATPQALLVCEFASIAGGALIWLANPSLRSPDSAEPTEDVQQLGRGGLHWINGAVLAVLAACVGATLVLTATDVGVVAALRDMGHQSWIGWELALWGLGSAIGGLVYGALHRSIPAGVLLALLAATTIPAGLANNALTLAALLVVAGFFCAPTLTATVDTLSRTVPENVRGEALGWHGSALTAGGAIGAPLAGVAVDQWGWQAGFIVPACVSLLAALALVGVTASMRERRTEVPAAA
jgi:MFS family permease